MNPKTIDLHRTTTDRQVQVKWTDGQATFRMYADREDGQFVDMRGNVHINEPQEYRRDPEFEHKLIQRLSIEAASAVYHVPGETDEMITVPLDPLA